MVNKGGSLEREGNRISAAERDAGMVSVGDRRDRDGGCLSL